MRLRSGVKRHDLPFSDLDMSRRKLSERPLLVFVGGVAVFSERLLNLVKSEFKDSHIINLEEISDLHRFDPGMRAAVELVIIDETTTISFSRMIRELEHFDPDAGPVFAYRTVELARDLLVEAHEMQSDRRAQFLPMRLSIEAWLASLRLLVIGEAFVPSELLRDTELALSKQPCQSAGEGFTGKPADKKVPSCPELGKLTTRERQIIALVSKGHRNRVIAKELGLSIHTVKLHVHNIFGKLGVDNRTSASNKFLSQSSSS